MSKIIKVLSLSVLMNFAASVYASEINKSHFEQSLTYTQQEFNVVGSATFSIWLWDIYTSKLITPSGKYIGIDAHPFTIYEITYLRDIESAELVKRTIEQWQHLGISAHIYQPYIGQLKQSWPDINKGDKLTLVVKNNQSAFYYNNKLTGIIDSKSFASLFLDIWLSKNTSQPDLRAQLLGD